MYAEIREMVNFLARFFHLRVPRLKIGMFCEHMANNCLFRFQPFWNISQPKQHEEQRVIRISHAQCDDAFTSAANAVGVLLEEFLSCLPENLIIYINPGEVYYCNNEFSPPVPIWLGSTNEDLNYNEGQKSATNSLIPPPLLSSNLAWRVPLSLVHPRELGYECTNPYNRFVMFRYVLPGTPNFTVETFANTRFGSYRKRPDHEKKFVDAIKHFMNSGGTSSEESQATTTTASNASLYPQNFDKWMFDTNF